MLVTPLDCTRTGHKNRINGKFTENKRRYCGRARAEAKDVASTVRVTAVVLALEPVHFLMVVTRTSTARREKIKKGGE